MGRPTGTPASSARQYPGAPGCNSTSKPVLQSGGDSLAGMTGALVT